MKMKLLHFGIPLLTVLASLPSLSRAQGLCDTTINNWDELMEAIVMNWGFVLLCPFRIEGESCPQKGAHVVNTHEHVELICEPSNNINPCEEPLCVIDCPSTLFDVSSRGSLVLEGIKVRGSTETAVRVQDHGSFLTYCSVFEDNHNHFHNGGAIYAYKHARLKCIDTLFRNNKGMNGGAIYHQGVSFLDGSSFEYNKAEMGGGAIYTGPSGTNNLINNQFTCNEAGLFGPAVFDAGMKSLQRSNSGSENTGSIGCNGISTLVAGVEKCEDFPSEGSSQCDFESRK